MSSASNRRVSRTRARFGQPAAMLAAADPSPANGASSADERLIAQRAYQLWLAEGRPEGRALAHWVQAQRDLSLI